MKQKKYNVWFCRISPQHFYGTITAVDDDDAWAQAKAAGVLRPVVGRA